MKRQNGIDVETAMEQSRQNATLSPRMAITRLTTTLNEKFIQPNDASTVAVQERWKTFMSRYSSLVPSAASNNKPIETESDFEYD